MTKGYSLVGHLSQIRAWASMGLWDEEIAVRLGANWESVARLRRQHRIPSGREILTLQSNLRTSREAAPGGRKKRDPEAEWSRLLGGRRFDE